MDFFKSAASYIFNGVNAQFPYNYSPADGRPYGSLWTIYPGRTAEGQPCTIITFDIKANFSRLPVARHLAQQLKVTRHPHIIKFLGSLETDSMIYLALEFFQPLNYESTKIKHDFLLRGLSQISQTIQFLNRDAQMILGPFSDNHIGIVASGEWKVVSLTLATSIKPDASDDFIVKYGNLLSRIEYPSNRIPPEVLSKGWDIIHLSKAEKVDAYSFGVFAYEVFNGSGSFSTDSMRTKGKLSAKLHNAILKITATNSDQRWSLSKFVTAGFERDGYFDTKFIKLSNQLDELTLLERKDRENLFNELQNNPNLFDSAFIDNKAIVKLLDYFLHSDGNVVCLKAILALSEHDASTTKTKMVSNKLREAFKSGDKMMRVCLLENIEKVLKFFEDSTLNDEIFSQIKSGFCDQALIVRELSVRSVVHIASRLNSKNLNRELIKLLGLTHNDLAPGIRTNTTICLAKIASIINADTRRKILIPAFIKGLNDPFLPARKASLKSIIATISFLDASDCAKRAIPALSAFLVARDTNLRVLSRKALEALLQHVYIYSDSLPMIDEEHELASKNGTTSKENKVEATASQLTGWAASSFASLALGETVTLSDEKLNEGPVLSDRSYSKTSAESPIIKLKPDATAKSEGPAIKPLGGDTPGKYYNNRDDELEYEKDLSEDNEDSLLEAWNDDNDWEKDDCQVELNEDDWQAWES